MEMRDREIDFTREHSINHSDEFMGSSEDGFSKWETLISSFIEIDSEV